MATAGAGLEIGVERFDFISQQIEESFLLCFSLLETHRVKLLERVNRMKELFIAHRDIEKSIKQMEGMIRATNELVTEKLVVGNKEQIVGLLGDRVGELRREKDSLETVYELKFLPNIEEFTQCVNKIHLRYCLPVEYNKRREPVVMEGITGRGEGYIGSASDVAVDGDTGHVYVTEYVKHVVCVYSLEGDFIREFGENLSYPNSICLSKEFVFVSNTAKTSITKFTKAGLYVNNAISVNEDLELKRFRNLCTYNDQTLYVCNSEEDIIEVFKLDLTYTGNFGKDELGSPIVMKIYNDTIFVLKYITGRILAYNTQHEYLTSIQLNRFDGLSLDRVYLTIDLNENFIVNSRDHNWDSCLKVFSSTGEFIESLGCGYLTQVQGIDVDRHNRIVSLSNYNLNIFQVY